MAGSVFPSRWPRRLLVAAVSLLLLGNLCWALIAARSIRDADRRMVAADAVIQRADSIVRDWVQRGCAPRTKPLP